MSREKISKNSRMCVDSVKIYPKLHQEFDLGETLGRGGFGEIYKARHKCDNQEYAIKIIKFDSNSNMKDAGKYRREANNLAKLSHNHIVRYYNSWIETARIPLSEYIKLMQSVDENSLSSEISKLSENGYMFVNNDYDDNDHDDDDDDKENEDNHEDEENDEVKDDIMDVDGDSVVTFESANENDPIKEVQFLLIQMELCEKRTLRTAIDEDLYQEEPRLNKYFREICEGLLHIHKNDIVHRDLKPENIFLTSGDVIKIGDFGLSKQIALENELENLTINDLPHGSLTGICGTNIYIAPEFSDGRNLFNNKADIYSLGVIYFEMCSRPMTQMEKCEQFPMTVQKLKNIQFPKNCSKKSKDLIKSMLHPNYNDRPSCADILKIFASEKSLGEVKEMMQQTKKVPYRQIKAFKKVLEGNGIEKCDLISQFTKIAAEIFELHGGHNIKIPTFLPSFNNSDNLTTLLNAHGNYISVSNKSRIGFSHYVQANHLEALRRYSVGKIFDEGYLLPSEKEECIFEALSPKPDHVTDAEILYMAKEMCNKVNKEEKNVIYININHRIIYSTVMKDYGISNENTTSFVKLSKLMPIDKEWKKLISRLKPELVLLLAKFWQPFNNIMQAEAEFTATLKNKYKALPTAFKELRMIVRNVEKFGIDTKNISLTPLLITDKHSSGFMFQVVLENPQIVVATGDRFDSLINRSMKYKKKQPKLLSSIGISFHVDNMLKLLSRSNALKCLVDVVILTEEKHKHEAIPLLRKLLAESIKCRIVHEISSNIPPNIVLLIELLEDNFCRAYVAEEQYMTSDISWWYRPIIHCCWTEEIFINIIKEEIESKTITYVHSPSFDIMFNISALGTQ